MIDVPTLIASTVTGGLLGTVITASVDSLRQGRTARSALIDPLNVVERARWKHDDPDGWRAFRDVARSLESVAILTRAPRAVIETYLAYAEASLRWVQDQDDLHDDPWGPSLSAPLSTATRACLELARDFAWRPLRSRPFAKRRLRAINETFDEAAPKHRWQSSTWPRHYVSTRRPKMTDRRLGTHVGRPRAHVRVVVRGQPVLRPLLRGR